MNHVGTFLDELARRHCSVGSLKLFFGEIPPKGCDTVKERSNSNSHEHCCSIYHQRTRISILHFRELHLSLNATNGAFGAVLDLLRNRNVSVSPDK
jgi:hypothetical protein